MAYFKGRKRTHGTSDSGANPRAISTGTMWTIGGFENWRISAVQKLENREEKPRFAGGKPLLSVT
jgi:hypothetical protein